MPRRVSKLSFDEARSKRTAWAVTFGDMVTLLLTFFVMLLVIMNDAEKHVDRVINMLLDETYKELHNQLHSAYVSVERVTKGVKVTLASGQLFRSGDSQLRPEVYPLIQQIGMIIKMSRLVKIQEDPELRPFVEAVEKKDHFLNIEIRCEGHTDNVPLPDELKYKWETNWELSTARALNVVEHLRQFAGISEDKFSAMGYGEFRPVDSNESPEGRANNRRVEVYLDAFLTTKTLTL
ncbi:MAG: flagellar motor protein MotB [Candidatus Neomarinimicrobiota bacterium]